jgi:hypothetical protein
MDMLRWVPSAESNVRHPLFGRFYLRFAAEADKRGGAEHRARLLKGLVGRLIEVGAATSPITCRVSGRSSPSSRCRSCGSTLPGTHAGR